MAVDVGLRLILLVGGWSAPIGRVFHALRCMQLFLATRSSVNLPHSGGVFQTVSGGRSHIITGADLRAFPVAGLDHWDGWLRIEYARGSVLRQSP